MTTDKIVIIRRKTVALAYREPKPIFENQNELNTLDLVNRQVQPLFEVLAEAWEFHLGEQVAGGLRYFV